MPVFGMKDITNSGRIGVLKRKTGAPKNKAQKKAPVV
jgi:hypothetical protein